MKSPRCCRILFWTTMFSILGVVGCGAGAEAEKAFYEGTAASDLDLSISYFTEAIRLNPEYAMAYYWRGDRYRKKSDFDRAIADYTEVIRLNPDFAAAYINRGVAYMMKKSDFEKAIADFTEAIRLNPDDVVFVYQNRAAAYLAIGKVDKANADFARMKQLERAPR